MKVGEKLAGNEKSGRNKLFDIKLDDLNAEIEKYKSDYDNGLVHIPNPMQLGARLGVSVDDIVYLIGLSESNSTYSAHGGALKMAVIWMQGIWSGGRYTAADTARVIHLLKQDFGVRRYDDRQIQQHTGDIRVIFGGSDKRGKDAFG